LENIGVVLKNVKNEWFLLLCNLTIVSDKKCVYLYVKGGQCYM